MSGTQKTALVTGASQGIGAGIVKGFVERGFNVVANSRKMTQSTEVAASDRVALVDGTPGEQVGQLGVGIADPGTDLLLERGIQIHTIEQVSARHDSGSFDRSVHRADAQN